MAIDTWVTYCKEAGMAVRDMDIMDCFLAGGQIIRTLRQLRPREYAENCTNSGMRPGGQVGLLHSLTPAELAQVREAAYRAVLPKLKGK
jgi:hypothetical protein